MRENEEAKKTIKEHISNGISNILMILLALLSIFLFIGFSITIGGIIWYISAVTIIEFKIPILYTILRFKLFGGTQIGLGIWYIICSMIIGFFIWKKVKKIFE